MTTAADPVYWLHIYMNKNTKRNREIDLKSLPKFKPGIQTESKAKNVRMVVLHNEGDDGSKASITRFECVNRERNVYNRFNHKASHAK